LLLTKHHGLGNEFLVVLDENNVRLPTIDGALARRLCDRSSGPGADGLIWGERSPSAGDVDVMMHLYNSDGSRAELSGNGLRCLAQAVAAARDDHALHLTVGTDAGTRSAIVDAGDDLQSVWVTVEMGHAAAGPAVPEEVAARVGGRHRSVDVGNPHLVVVVDDPAGIDLATEGPWIEAWFEAGINVEYITVTAPDTLRLTVWERGAGITQACGTGACAAVVAAHEWGLVGTEVQVAMPGGTAEVVLGRSFDDPITLAGPTSLIATIELTDA
jgi:diaminopimelate epimerase